MKIIAAFYRRETGQAEKYLRACRNTNAEQGLVSQNATDLQRVLYMFELRFKEVKIDLEQIIINSL